MKVLADKDRRFYIEQCQNVTQIKKYLRKSAIICEK